MQANSEPSWLEPRNDRKTPYTDAEFDVLADDLIARMAYTSEPKFPAVESKGMSRAI